jgi:hypothetical protein
VIAFNGYTKEEQAVIIGLILVVISAFKPQYSPF